MWTNRQNGQSLIEIMLGVGIFAVFLIGIVSAIVPALHTRTAASDIEVASSAGGELLNNVLIASEANWPGTLERATGTAHTYFMNASTSPFSVATGTETLAIGTSTITRYFFITDAYRDTSGNLTSSPLNYDPATKLVNVVYKTLGGATGTLATYITRNNDSVYSQGDWSGGAGDAGPITAPKNDFFTASTSVNWAGLGVLTLLPGADRGGVESPVIDMGAASGAMLHSVYWSGTAPGGSAVDFQFATSSSPTGPWNFVGSDGTALSFFSVLPNASAPLITTTNNYTLFKSRYFRYIVRLSPDNGKTVAPSISQITIHWSQ